MTCLVRCRLAPLLGAQFSGMTEAQRFPSLLDNNFGARSTRVRGIEGTHHAPRTRLTPRHPSIDGSQAFEPSATSPNSHKFASQNPRLYGCGPPCPCHYVHHCAQQPRSLCRATRPTVGDENPHRRFARDRSFDVGAPQFKLCGGCKQQRCAREPKQRLHSARLAQQVWLLPIMHTRRIWERRSLLLRLRQHVD